MVPHPRASNVHIARVAGALKTSFPTFGSIERKGCLVFKVSEGRHGRLTTQELRTLGRARTPWVGNIDVLSNLVTHSEQYGAPIHYALRVGPSVWCSIRPIAKQVFAERDNS